MRNLDVNIGRRCNLRCVFCLDGGVDKKKRQWLPLEQAQAELTQGYASGCRAMGLLGGEPTAYPHLFEVLAHARRLGFQRLALHTNGLRFGDLKFADRVVAAGVTRLGISFHSHRPELEAQLTGRPDAFEHKLRGLRRLVGHQRRGRLAHGLAVNPVITQVNLPHLRAIFHFFAGVGVEDFRFNFVRAIGRAYRSEELTPRYADAAAAATRLIVDNERRVRRHLSFGDFPLCVFPRQIIGKKTLRERYIGEFHDLVTDVALFDAPKEKPADGDRFNWADRRRERLKLKFAACEGCAFYGPCEGVYRSYVEIHGHGEFGAVDEQGVRLRPDAEPEQRPAALDRPDVEMPDNYESPD